MWTLDSDVGEAKRRFDTARRERRGRAGGAAGQAHVVVGRVPQPGVVCYAWIRETWKPVAACAGLP